MIALLQLLKFLDVQQRLAVRELLLDLDEGITAEDAVDMLPQLLVEWDIELELSTTHREQLLRVLNNGSALSAFRLMEVA